MKRLFLLLLTRLSAEIFEVHHFHELLPYLEEESCLILDIDDTLLVPAQTLGTDVWFRHQWSQNKTHLPAKEAFEKALADWVAVRYLTKMKLVEEGCNQILENLQSNSIPIMGCTAQGLHLAQHTANILESLGIDLSKTAPHEKDHYLHHAHGVLYHRGILSTSGTSKGTALTHFFDLIGYYPQHVLFVDDKLAPIQDVEKHLTTKNIHFTGLRYTHSDSRISSFRPEIAEIQWSHSSFDRILSDEEAEALLLKKAREKKT